MARSTKTAGLKVRAEQALDLVEEAEAVARIDARLRAKEAEEETKGVRMPTIAGAAETTLTGTVVGKGEGVEYLACPDGFAIVFKGPAPAQTKYGTPCYHFGGRGADRPVYALADGRNVGVNPGTLSIVPSKGAKEERRAMARIDKALEGLDPAVIAQYFASRGAQVRVEE